MSATFENENEIILTEVFEPVFETITEETELKFQTLNFLTIAEGV